MVVYEEKYFEAYTKDQHICHKKYFTITFHIRESQARLEFLQLTKGCPDVNRFPVGHMVKTHFLLENL